MRHMKTKEGIPTWTVTDRLAKARQVAGLSGAELAQRIGVARSTIVNYESPTYETRKDLVLREWARVCDVSFEWLKGELDLREQPLG